MDISLLYIIVSWGIAGHHPGYVSCSERLFRKVFPDIDGKRLIAGIIGGVGD
ncbi:MAG TPA: hypothetical protein VI914_02440 [Thermodesulfobacteriota bacterium]|nr:hypothetical protein [Thermodesulfobacteriota bacterium]